MNNNPFDELAARMDHRMDKIEAMLLEKANQRPEPMLPVKDKLMTVNQAAKFLNTTPGALYQKVHKGMIPHSKRGRLYFSEKELWDWYNTGRRQTVAEIQNEAIKALKAETALVGHAN
ncbi:MAG: helix-turn-helix domain-containing protein [Bacteroidales bacterium]|nr:helix-turn-helix domain-containing protein [Bacteroidales bacterium]